MAVIELNYSSKTLEANPSKKSHSCPGNVWISTDKTEVLVTGGNIHFHEGREFHAGFSNEKSTLDCALEAFERGFSGYYKKRS